MQDVYICDYIRTPIGRYGGGLSTVRTDELSALPIKALLERSTSADWDDLNEVILGCANQSGEDNRNVARMSVLLSGLPVEIPGLTVNRLCGSGMDAVIAAGRAIRLGDANMIIAGGVESMTRAPLVMPKSSSAFSRQTDIYDTTIGWRFINRNIEKEYGIDSMPETAENIASQFGVSREDQDEFAFQSHTKAHAATQSGRLQTEIVAVEVVEGKKTVWFSEDEQIRPDTTPERLAKLSTPFRQGGTVTAGNAAGINDGAAALLLASGASVKRNNLKPIARLISSVVSGVEPRIMGVGPVSATRKLCLNTGLAMKDFDVIELNEAFAAQALACLRAFGLEDFQENINPNGGAISLGHPLGMSGARLIGTAALELHIRNAKHALVSMCVGVGQGMSVAISSV